MLGDRKEGRRGRRQCGCISCRSPSPLRRNKLLLALLLVLLLLLLVLLVLLLVLCLLSLLRRLKELMR